MKKPVVKVLSLTLCAVLALSGAARAMTAPADPGSAPSGERNFKDETVYVLASADGSPEKIIVSDWIRNVGGGAAIEDATELTGIENVKGDETFTLDGDGVCVWDAKGNDVYYQGSIDKELPVSVAVSYTLDGAPVSPEELAGKSGRVTIRFDYTNHAYELAEIGGKQEKIYVPFVLLTGVVLDNDVFSNVTVTNGRIVNDGDRTIVAGLALPGLQDSLGLDREDLELPEYVEIAADAEDFALETTVTLAANGLFNDAASRAGERDGLEALDGKLDELTDAMGRLTEGSARLYDGLCTLLDSSRELTAGIDRLAAGASQLKQGADALSAGAAQLQTGAAALDQGLSQLAGQNDALNGGAAQVFQSLLAAADAQLRAAGAQTPALTVENYGQVLDGVIAAAGDSPAGQQAAALKASLDSYNGFCQGLRQYTAGVAQCAAGAGELNAGVGSVKAGADSLSAGAGQLRDGVQTMQNSAPALIDGVSQLRDGAKELSGGLSEFDEKVVGKLAEVFDGDLSGLMERLDAVRAVSGRYASFSGLSAHMDGQVKFLWRTRRVGG